MVEEAEVALHCSLQAEAEVVQQMKVEQTVVLGVAQGLQLREVLNDRSYLASLMFHQLVHDWEAEEELQMVVSHPGKVEGLQTLASNPPRRPLASSEAEEAAVVLDWLHSRLPSVF